MGGLFTEGDGFFREEAKKFTGLEYFPLPMRSMMQFIFKTFAKKMFQKMAVGFQKECDHKMYCSIMTIIETLKKRMMEMIETIKKLFMGTPAIFSITDERNSYFVVMQQLQQQKIFFKNCGGRI